MKRLRLYYWLLRAYLKRHSKGVYASIFLIGLFIANFGLFAANLYEPFFDFYNQKLFKPEIIEGVVGSVKIINPIYASNSSEKELSKLIFRGLTKTSNSGELVPDLAESIVARSDKEFIFTLKKGITWHDGHPFTADDVIYTYKIVSSSVYKTGLESTFKDIGVTKLDDYTVEFKLKEAFSPFLSQTSLGIIPRHISLDQFRPIGTGQLKVTFFNKEKITLENNGLKLTFKFYPSADLAVLALKQGQVHNLGGLSYEQVKEFKNWPNLKVLNAVVGNRYIAIFFNTKNPIFNSKSIRQAVNYAFNKDQILNQETSQVGEATVGSIGKNSWVRTNEVKKYEFNQDLARSMLEKEGWQLKDGFREKEGKKLEFNVAYTESPHFAAIISQLETDLKNVGIKLNRVVFNVSQLHDQIIINRDFDLLLTTHELDPDPDQYVFWHSTQATNITGLNSVKVDKALEDGRKLLNLEERQTKYRDFQKFVIEEAPAVFLYYPKYYYIVTQHLSNVDLSNFDAPDDRFNSLNLWKITRPF